MGVPNALFNTTGLVAHTKVNPRMGRAAHPQGSGHQQRGTAMFEAALGVKSLHVPY